ncbi:COX assembly mitochondrial protein 2 homolog [Anoplophora glabripennis]|uniref:COX assembly mitochondrial protein 2 homolog n=1 Tax=Anoplophora glabripennis TaxID=217634 RepID=UPI000874045F|nr:COX assembly mitochondrial protein 2 homolog [Anoplophora glabripennis]
MHTDLSPHLHTEKCNIMINLLMECRREHPFRKFVGFCNSFYHQMTKCLKEERLARRARNYEKSLEMKKKFRKPKKEDTEYVR